ncbi:hypothetical protein [Tannockella kyphosi]|uniref:hypothetical protein n=1 Tax=Tannockella kyphosi TaxID=2899121 RepID=UPI002011942D|nr:hypothetical protein [Tannockella kyphosi]
MFIKIKKLQFLCSLCLLFQVFLASWFIPFHLIAAILSIFIILWQRRYKAICIQYHYYILCLYFFRIYLLSTNCWYFLEFGYLVSVLFLGMFLFLISLHAIL